MKVGELTAAYINDTEYYMRLNQLPNHHMLHGAAEGGGYNLVIKKSPYTGEKCWYFKIQSIQHFSTQTAIAPVSDFYGIKIIVGHDIEIGVE